MDRMGRILCPTHPHPNLPPVEGEGANMKRKENETGDSSDILSGSDGDMLLRVGLYNRVDDA